MFIVFYNGEEEQPAKKEYRLSDAYMHQEDNPSLELVVVQLNINKGYNDDLLEKCPTLREYMLNVDTVRNYRKSMPLDEAVNKAVDECIKNGILAEFLKRNKREAHEHLATVFWSLTCEPCIELSERFLPA